MAQAQANGITIEYEIHGEGEPLLLIMGLGGQLISWPAGFVEALAARGYQVIVFDNRDIGLSTKGTRPAPSTGRTLLASLSSRVVQPEYLLADMSDDAAALLDALGIGSAHVLGISMGGMIAQSLAIAHPHRVRSLVSVMSTTGNKRVGRASLRLLLKLRKLVGLPRERAVDASVEMFGLISGSQFDAAEARRLAEAGIARSFHPDGTARQTAAIMSSPDRTPALQQLDVPTLVVHGMQDPLVMPSGGIATARAIPGARLLMFPDMGHNLPKSRWPEFLDAVQANTARARQVVPVG